MLHALFDIKAIALAGNQDSKIKIKKYTFYGNK
jgi:hypothetical protein